MTEYKWSTEDIYKMIDMFKEREFLWNTSLDAYRDRDKKQEGWCQIAHYFNMDRHTIERKMRSLVGQFQRELRRPKGLENTKWFAFKKLLFLKDRKASGLDETPETEQHNEDIEKQIKTCDVDKKTIQTPESSIELLPDNICRKNPRLELEIQNKATGTSEIDKNIVNVRQTRDHCDVFGEFVAMKLKELNNSYARNTAQYLINNILYNASIGEYDWPSNVHPNETLANIRINDVNRMKHELNDDTNVQQ